MIARTVAGELIHAHFVLFESDQDDTPLLQICRRVTISRQMSG